MGRRKKDESQQIKSAIVLSDRQVTIWIASHGIKKAERIAELTLQKIRASRKRLEAKYKDE